VQLSIHYTLAFRAKLQSIFNSQSKFSRLRLQNSKFLCIIVEALFQIKGRASCAAAGFDANNERKWLICVFDASSSRA